MAGAYDGGVTAMPEPADGSVVGLALALVTLLVMAWVIAREWAAERSEEEQ